MPCTCSCYSNKWVFFHKVLCFCQQWHSSSTGLASSCHSVWLHQLLADTEPSLALACPSSNGFSLSGWELFTEYWTQFKLRNDSLVLLCLLLNGKTENLNMSYFWGTGLIHVFFIIQFSTYFPGYFDGQYWLWWVFLALGTRQCFINSISHCYSLVIVLCCMILTYNLLFGP